MSKRPVFHTTLVEPLKQSSMGLTANPETSFWQKKVLAIRRIFSLVDMITNTKFSICPNVFIFKKKIGVIQQ